MRQIDWIPMLFVNHIHPTILGSDIFVSTSTSVPTTVDGADIPNNHLGCIKPVVNNGISTNNLNWWTPDFWTINSRSLFLVFFPLAFKKSLSASSRRAWRQHDDQHQNRDDRNVERGVVVHELVTVPRGIPCWPLETCSSSAPANHVTVYWKPKFCWESGKSCDSHWHHSSVSDFTIQPNCLLEVQAFVSFHNWVLGLAKRNIWRLARGNLLDDVGNKLIDSSLHLLIEHLDVLKIIDLRKPRIMMLQQAEKAWEYKRRHA